MKSRLWCWLRLAHDYPGHVVHRWIGLDEYHDIFVYEGPCRRCGVRSWFDEGGN